MKEIFLKNSISFITHYKKYTKDDIEKLKYGLEGIYLTFYKLIIILFISFLLGTLQKTIIFLLLFNIIRYPAFGFHAKTSTECLFISLILIIGLPFLLLKLKLNFYIKLFIGICCLLLFYFYAPADTIKRPLPNMKKRRVRKILSVGCCLLYIVLCLLFKNFYISDLFLAAIITEAILISPMMYQLFKQPYKNYLNC